MSQAGETKAPVEEKQPDKEETKQETVSPTSNPESKADENAVETEEVKMCGPCSKDETEVHEEKHPYGVAYCYDCSEYLCDECVKFHGKLKVTSTHRVVEVDNLDDDVSYLDLLHAIESCPNHPKKNLEYFCRDHDYLCCSQCVIGAHRRCGHVITLYKHAKVAKEDSKHDRLKHDLQRYKKYLDGIVSKDSDNIEILETELTEVPRKLEEFRSLVTRTVDSLESRIKEESEREYTSEKSKLSDHLDQGKKLQKAMTEAHNLLESAIQQGTDSQLFIAAHVVNRKMDDFERSLRSIAYSARNHTVNVCVNEARLKSLELALEVVNGSNERETAHFPKRRPLQDKPPRPTPETFFSKRRGYEPLVD